MNPVEVPDQTADALVHLEAGALRMTLAPSVGGAIAAFWSERDGARTDWLRPATPAALAQRNPSGMASYPLLPWCNRIRDGHARFGVREIDVPPGHPASPSGRHPLHGLGWLRSWTVDEATPARVKLSLQVDACAAWPWRFECEVISYSQQRKIIKTAQFFLQRYPNYYNFDCRFDVICFDFPQKLAKTLQPDFSKLKYDQQWIKHAFTLD